MAQANIVLADAQATPVNHTFIPIGRDPKDPDLFWWEDQSAASVIGYWRIGYRLKRPGNPVAGQSSAGRNIRASVTMYQPVLEVPVSATYNGIAPSPTVSHVSKVITEYFLPERGTLQNRKDLRKMNANLQAETALVAMVETLVPVN